MAATPNPDRPSVSRSGYLVAPDTLELELGVQWAGAASVPSTLKYSIAQVVEPRVSANLSGVEAGTPGLEGGAKVRLIDEGKHALALWAGSAIPVSTDEPYFAQLHGLFTTGLGQGVGLQLNSGLDLVGNGGGGVALNGVPAVGALSLSVTNKLSVFGELAGRIAGPGCEDAACAYGDLILDGGAGLLLTEILMLDAGAGWFVAEQQPYATVGITANFGSIR